MDVLLAPIVLVQITVVETRLTMVDKAGGLFTNGLRVVKFADVPTEPAMRNVRQVRLTPVLHLPIAIIESRKARIDLTLSKQANSHPLLHQTGLMAASTVF
jgi:hypothetical protein